MFPGGEMFDVAMFLYHVFEYKDGDQALIISDLLALGVDIGGEFADEIIDVVKSAKKTVSNMDNIITKGKKFFKSSVIENAYIKPRHLSSTPGSFRKFLASTKAEAEVILKDAMRKGNIKSIMDNGLTSAGNRSYQIIIDAGKAIKTRGETPIKIIIAEDGGMLSVFPIK